MPQLYRKTSQRHIPKAAPRQMLNDGTKTPWWLADSSKTAAARIFEVSIDNLFFRGGRPKPTAIPFFSRGSWLDAD